MPAPFCGKCGTPLRVDALFCTTCGTPTTPSGRDDVPLPAPPDPAPPAPPSTPISRATGSRRRWLLPVGVGGLFLVLVAGVLVVWLTSRDADEHDHTAGRAGRLAVRLASIDHGVTVQGEPGRTWDLDADDIEPGGRFTPLDPNSDDELFSPTAVTIDDSLIVAVTGDSGGDEPSTTVAAIAADGDLRWTSDEIGEGCWAFDNTYLVCTDRASETSHLNLVDPSTGKETASIDVDPYWGVDPVEYRGVLYAATGSTAPTEVVAIDLRSFRLRWRTPISLTDDNDYSEIYGGFSVTDNEIDLTSSDANAGGGYRLLSFDRPTGDLQASDRLSDSTHIEGPWTVTDEWDPESLTVTRAGETVFERSGDSWSGPDSQVVFDGRVGVDASLYDIQSGDTVWSREDLVDLGTTSWSWTGDGDQVLAESIDEANSTSRTVALDARTGTTQWTVDDTLYPTIQTDDAFIETTYGDEATTGFTVISRDDGRVSWTRDVTDLSGSEEEYGGESTHLYLSDTVLWAVGPATLRGFTDFPAQPGSTRDDSGDGDDDDDTAYVTACGSPPTFTPIESEAANGGVTITYRVTAVCSGGQWLNDSQLSVPFRVDDYDYASGYFDFSGDPYWIPDADAGGTELHLVYPFENVQAPESRIADAIDRDGGTGTVVQVPCEPGEENTGGTVPADPGWGGDPDDPTTADGAPEQDTDDARNETALEALRRIAREDEDAIEALGTNWTAQLSSKKPGTRDDGIVYDSYDDILALHLQHRARYPDTLLAWSNDWSGSFGPSSQDYWVTLSGRSEPTTRPILRWCRTEGWGLGDCWAKRLARNGDPASNTDKNKPDERNN